MNGYTQDKMSEQGRETDVFLPEIASEKINSNFQQYQHMDDSLVATCNSE